MRLIVGLLFISALVAHLLIVAYIAPKLLNVPVLQPTQSIPPSCIEASMRYHGTLWVRRQGDCWVFKRRGRWISIEAGRACRSCHQDNNDSKEVSRAYLRKRG